jgi:copper(I)-binding protein
MSTTSSSRRLATRGSALLLVLGLVLSGCGDDPKPTRDQVREKRINDGVRRGSVSARVRDIRLQVVRIERPEGAFAQGSNSAMFLALSNSGKDDRLVGATTPDAGSVVQRDGAGEPRATIDVAVPAGNVVSLQSPYGLHLELTDLETDLGGRSFVPVTFTFAEAGEVTVEVVLVRVARQVVPSRSPSVGG